MPRIPLSDPKRASKTKKLGLAMCTALVVGNMIGSGIFLLPATLGIYGGISILGWLVSAAGACLLALVFARLSREIRRAGGPYAYARSGFGEFPGFMVAWGYWISIWTTNAAIAVAFVSYLTVFWPALNNSSALAAGVGLAAIWLLTWVNGRGVHQAGMVQLVTTILKLIPLIAIATLGLAYVKIENFSPFNASDGTPLSAVTATVALTVWAFLGLESGSIPSDDVEDPVRTIPRATVLGTLSTGVVYLLSTVAIMGVIPASSLAVSNAPFADAARVMWGDRAAFAVGVGAAISCFGALNGWLLLQGQIPLAAANDGLFLKAFGRRSKRGTPLVGLTISSALASILLLMNYSRSLIDQFKFIILLATLNTLVPYVFASLTELMLSLRTKGGRPQLLRALIAFFAFLFSFWAIAGAGRDIVYWGFLLIVAGFPVYAWIQMRKPAAEPQEAGLG